METKVMPFVKYIGSKVKIAKLLISHIPPHNMYVEPFMGSAAFYFQKEKAKSNILNDFNGDLVNLICSVRDERDWMINWVWNTPFSEEIHRKIFTAYTNKSIWNKLPKRNRACGYFYMLQLAYNESVGNLAYPAEKLASGTHKWNQERLVKELLECSQKLHGTYITNRSYVDLIVNPKINKETTFWFLDPPYTMAGDKKYYQHNFVPKDHYAFAQMCHEIEGYFLITYDPHPLIKDLFKDYYQAPLPGYKAEWIISNYEIDWNKE